MLSNKLFVFFILILSYNYISCSLFEKKVNIDECQALGDKYYYNGMLFEGKIVSHYSNGQLKTEFQIKDGRKNGVCKEWYNNAQIKTLCRHKSGKKIGKCINWYKTGKKKKESIYSNGIITTSFDFI